ncbi:MAG: hypothetical protein FWD26_09605 [Treponema sp.]|nr:hypothetical protein [Treponema sp.]
MPKKPIIIEPINGTFEQVIDKIVETRVEYKHDKTGYTANIRLKKKHNKDNKGDKK